MWNPDDEKKKVTLAPQPQTVPTVNIKSDREVFKYSFLNSTDIRKAYGFEKKDGQIVLVNDSWMKSTVDIDKIQWITEIVIEYNKNNKG